MPYPESFPETEELVAGAAKFVNYLAEVFADGFDWTDVTVVAKIVADDEVRAAFDGITKVDDELKKAKPIDVLKLIRDGVDQAIEELEAVGE